MRTKSSIHAGVAEWLSRWPRDPTWTQIGPVPETSQPVGLWLAGVRIPSPAPLSGEWFFVFYDIRTLRMNVIFRMSMKERKGLCFAVVALILLLLASANEITPVEACYGPHIIADIDKNEVYLNETVTIKGQICPVEPNVSVRVTFTRPDYTSIDQYVLADPWVSC